MDDTEASDITAERTQSLQAWSEEEPTEVVRYRSWRLPLALTAVALTAAAVAGAILWPHHQGATKPQVAPEKPQVEAPKPETPDQRFVRLLGERHTTVVSPPLAVKAAHLTCETHGRGVADPDIAQGLMQSTPGADMRSMSIFVDTAREVYCP